MKVMEGRYGYTGRRVSESYASNKTLKLVHANGCLKSDDFLVFKIYGLTLLWRWGLNSSYCLRRREFWIYNALKCLHFRMVIRCSEVGGKWKITDPYSAPRTALDG